MASVKEVCALAGVLKGGRLNLRFISLERQLDLPKDLGSQLRHGEEVYAPGSWAASGNWLRGRAMRAGVALDELYGAGHGEGAASRLDGAAGEAGQLGVREWLEELRDLFGEPVAEHVVGRAAERGKDSPGRTAA